jgi:hypothetical protein
MFTPHQVFGEGQVRPCEFVLSLGNGSSSIKEKSISSTFLKKSKNLSPKSKRANWHPSQEVKEKNATLALSFIF